MPAPAKPAALHKHYSTPLPRKLGLVTAKGGVGEVALLGEPEGFWPLLGELPGSVSLQPRLREATKLALCFVRSRAELMSLLDLLTGQLPPLAHVWLIHPKAPSKPDFNQHNLRDAALDIGLVDYKVCSVDDDWSGLKFAWRGQSASPGHRMMKK
jgi:hypothetical protein